MDWNTLEKSVCAIQVYYNDRMNLVKRKREVEKVCNLTISAGIGKCSVFLWQPHMARFSWTVYYLLMSFDTHQPLNEPYDIPVFI